jgi:hypothetical protein
MMPLALVSAVLIAAPVPKEEEERFEKGVAAARANAINFLKRKQNEDGNWESVGLTVLIGQEGGLSGLVALSLLEAGVPVNGPAISKAVD